MKTAIDSSIFRDYDIRGTYPDQINEDSFYILGKAISDYLSVQKIAVGYDARLSSPSLFGALAKGIMEQGTDVVNLGLISTEIHYFASGKYNFDANVIISASHNPANYNGLKIVTRGVVPLHGSFGLPDIKKLSIAQKFTTPRKVGSMTEMSILDEWIKHALSFINAANLRPLKVVVDAGNGMGGISWAKISGKIPGEIIPLYFEPDGNFPHHLPDPLKAENLADLQKEILAKSADLGIALDGDADRIFLLDEKGEAVSGTITTAILAEALLKKYGPNPVLYNAVCGRIVPETIKKLGGNPIRVRVGHSFIKEYMKKTDALFAGEHSGHYYFKDNFRADSSAIAGLIILEYLSEKNMPFSEVVSVYDKYPQSGEINFQVKSGEKIVSSLESNFVDALSIDKIDGLSVWYPAWWFNLRPSKTESYVRLNVEAD
ncbi:phosphomannomutase/phosphoglucomutase, partial [Candidatus Gottesmanbacteria bacterium]|nr:phosphomannomutase/phosphoglucomutase [Candidatus Gottesmanbacteria bacterium]